MAGETAPSAYGQQAPLGRRAAGFALAAIANILLILMLLSLAPFAPHAPPAQRPPVLIELPPAQRAARARTVSRRTSGGAPRRPAVAPPVPPPPPTPPVPWNIMMVSKEVFAASDISKLPQRSTQVASGASSGAGAGADTGAADSPAETGPGGERLYNAQWYVEPTNAELNYYLPANAPRTGVATIACRTVARFRVEDCVELSESPTGSGLARAIRQAAWQFKVRPPSIGGRPQVGAWVRIRIDFSVAAAK